MIDQTTRRAERGRPRTRQPQHHRARDRRSRAGCALRAPCTTPIDSCIATATAEPRSGRGRAGVPGDAAVPVGVGGRAWHPRPIGSRSGSSSSRHRFHCWCRGGRHPGLPELSTEAVVLLARRQRAPPPALRWVGQQQGRRGRGGGGGGGRGSGRRRGWRRDPRERRWTPATAARRWYASAARAEPSQSSAAAIHSRSSSSDSRGAAGRPNPIAWLVRDFRLDGLLAGHLPNHR